MTYSNMAKPSFREILGMSEGHGCQYAFQLDALTSIAKGGASDSFILRLIDAPDLADFSRIQVFGLPRLSKSFDKVKIAALLERPHLVIQLLRRLSIKEVADFVHLIPGLFPDFIEAGILVDTDVSKFSDTHEQIGFKTFAHGLFMLRSEFPAEPIPGFVFPGFADLALLVAANKFNVAIDRLSKLASEDVDLGWLAVANHVAGYALFGRYWEDIKTQFPDLAARSFAIYDAAVKRGLINEEILKVVRALEAPQIPRSLETVMSPEKCRQILVMGRYAILRILSMTGFDPREQRPAITTVLEEYTETQGGRTIQYEQYELETPLEDIAKFPSFWLYLLANPTEIQRLGNLIPELLVQLGENIYLGKLCVKFIAYQRTFGYYLGSVGKGREENRARVVPNPTQLLEIINRYDSYIRGCTREPAVAPAAPKLTVAIPKRGSPDNVASAPGTPLKKEEGTV
jgi:hypothetical protein